MIWQDSSELQNVIGRHNSRSISISGGFEGREDRVAFDNKARAHASSCTVTPLLEPMDAIFPSILVEQEKEIKSLKEGFNLSGLSP